MAWVVGLGIFAFLAFNFPKQVGGLVLILIAAAGAWYLWDSNEKAKREREKSSIVLFAAMDPSSCPTADHPLRVSFTNGSKRTVTKIDFSITGRRNGYSGAIFSSGYGRLQTDRIIPPGQTWHECWSSPPLSFGVQQNAIIPPQVAEWSASASYITFAK